MIQEANMTPAIELAKQSLHKEVERLVSEVDGLEARLVSVLTPDVNFTASTNGNVTQWAAGGNEYKVARADTRIESSLSNEIRQVTEKIGNVCIRLSEIKRRLEL